MTQSNFDTLTQILFEGEVRAFDVKTMPGTDETASRDHLAGALLASMQRMGIVKDGALVDKK